MNSCPTTEILQQWFAGTPNGPEREVIDAHVKECVTCQQTLAGLGGGPRVIRQPLRGGESPFTPRYPVPPDFLRRLEANNPLLAAAEEPERDEVQFPGPPTDRGPLGQLDRFHIIEELGRGNFGFVFRAWDEQLGRAVAIKILKPELAASDKDRGRLVREAQAAAGIDSDHVVRVHEAGSLPDFASPFLVMEYIPGETLAALLKRRTTLPPAEAAEICRQAALGLAAAHARGLIHRDVKPSNIVIVPHTSDQGEPAWRAKITDFGLARAIEAISEGSVRSGQLVGTPAYMSPEQITVPKSLDGRSDVYSLGVVLYELLTGERPFRGVTYHAVLNQVMHEEPASPRKLNPAIPRDLGTICLKALAKEPGRRYASAGALADDLRRFLDRQPIQARPAGAGERLWRWSRRNPAVAGLAAVALVLLSAGTIVSTFFAVQANQSAKVARHHLYRAHMNLAQRYWEDGEMSQVLDLLGQHEPQPGALDERGWEWHYLWRLCHAELHTWNTQSETINALAFSPDGRRLASADQRAMIHLWDTVSRQLLRTFHHDDAARRVAFSPNGQLLAACGDGRMVEIWNVEDGRLLHALQGHHNGIGAIAFQGNDRLLTAGHVGGTVQMWDVVAGRLLRTVPGHHVLMEPRMAFSPDGRLLASASDDYTVKVWDTLHGRELRTLEGHTSYVYSVAFSPDRRRLASASHDGTAKIWNAATGEELCTVKGHNSPVTRVLFHRENERLVTGDEHGVIKIWDVATGQELCTLKGHTKQVWGLDFSPDGHRLASAGNDDTVRMWDARPLTSESAVEREAVGLVEFLFAKSLLKAEVQTHVRADPTISEPVRREALAIVERAMDDPDRFHSASAAILRRADAAASEYRNALGWAETACRLDPDRGDFQTALGTAQFRLGQYPLALATLKRAEELSLLHWKESLPATLAALAMTQHRLGQTDPAQATLKRLRDLFAQQQWKEDPESRAYDREAEDLIAGKPAQPAN